MHAKSSPVTPRTIRRSLRKRPFPGMARHALLHPHFRSTARIDFGRRPVASFTGNFRFCVKPVREEDVCRHPAIEAKRPLRRLGKRPCKPLDFRRFRKRQIVAVHAVGPRRHRRPDSEIGARVALRTVHAQVFPVLLVAERNFFRRFVGIFGKGAQIPDDKRDAAYKKREHPEPGFGVFEFQDATTILREPRNSAGRSVAKKNNFLRNQNPSFLYLVR